MIARENTFLQNTRPPFCVLTMVKWVQNQKGGLSLRYYLAIDIGASVEATALDNLKV